MPFKDDIYDNQTAILRWIKSRGGRVEGLDDADEAGYHQRRSCSVKRRFKSLEDARAVGGPSMDIYECKYCLGLHLATPRS